MNISIAKIKDYDKEQRTINNERYSKQSQSKPMSKIKAGEESIKTDCEMSDIRVSK